MGRSETAEKISPQDAAIIARIRRGDKGAFDDLIERHRQRAYNYAYRLTSNPDVAADVVADAFLRVYRSLDSFKGDSSFTTWLFRIETNCFLDMRKKAKSRLAVSLEDVAIAGDSHLDAEVIDEGETPHERAEKSERLAVIQAAMKVLPGHQRTILMMYHAEEMSYEAIAEALSLPIGTVKSRLNRARISLQGILRPCRKLFILPGRRQRALAIT